jgi:hypothetical protein
MPAARVCTQRRHDVGDVPAPGCVLAHSSDLGDCVTAARSCGGGGGLVLWRRQRRRPSATSAMYMLNYILAGRVAVAARSASRPGFCAFNLNREIQIGRLPGT